jgi:adenylate cyclase
VRALSSYERESPGLKVVCRLHTFLFADLAGFTRFTARHGDDRAAELAVCFYEHVRELARAHGCEAIKAIGDAVMVRGHDGDAMVKLAARILALADEHGFPPVRVGLDTGPAVQRGGDWFGATVNVAARVTSAASPGELLLTERTREAYAGALCERGRYRLKGLPEHVLFGTKLAA